MSPGRCHGKETIHYSVFMYFVCTSKFHLRSLPIGVKYWILIFQAMCIYRDYLLYACGCIIIVVQITADKITITRPSWFFFFLDVFYRNPVFAALPYETTGTL
jgi:hypothetical protein